MKEKGLTAVWDMDYDFRTDTNYQRPCCPECREPIFLQDTEYQCVSCGKAVRVEDDEMKQWFQEKSETKEQTEQCVKFRDVGCGQMTMKVRYIRNPVTLEWQTAYGQCENCGARFIV